jgi:hypothetical protein
MEEATSVAAVSTPVPITMPRVTLDTRPTASTSDSSSDDEIGGGMASIRRAMASRQKALQAAAKAREEAEAKKRASRPADVSRLLSDRGKHSLANLAKQARARKGKMSYEELDRLAAQDVRPFPFAVVHKSILAHRNVVMLAAARLHVSIFG